jgi:glucoamylase
MVRAAAAALLTLAIATPAQARERAPGAPGAKQTWAGPDKEGFGTSAGRRSRVWFTLDAAHATEVFYPDLFHPAARGIDFWVDGRRERGRAAAGQSDPASPTYRQTIVNARWRLRKSYVTDPKRQTLLVRVRLDSLDGKAHRLVVRYDPSLYASGNDDVGWTRGDALLAHDRHAASALVARPVFGRTSSGYAGSSAGRLSHPYDALRPGNVVQTAQTPVTGQGAHRTMTLALGFGLRASLALDQAHDSLRAGFTKVAAAYAAGWRAWRARLHPLPGAAVPHTAQYETSLQMLHASEDKAAPGAFAPAPRRSPRARVQYDAATALLLAGDVDAADRALDVLLDRFPDSPWGPVLAWELARADRDTWRAVRAPADFLLGHDPGTAPGALAASVAGLVCAADLARRNDERTLAARYDRLADRRQAKALRPASDPGFLELARLGVRPAGDPVVAASAARVAARPALTWAEVGARGEYELASGRSAASALAALAGAAHDGGPMPDKLGGKGAAAPSARSHAQFVRLAWDAEAGRVLEQPSIVASRYAGGTP